MSQHAAAPQQPPATVSMAEFQQMQQMLQHLHTVQQAQQQAAAAAAATAATQPAQPRMPKIPPPSKFRGESGFRVDEWLRELQHQFDYYHRDLAGDEHRVRFAVAFMQDLASQWWSDHLRGLNLAPGVLPSWTDFVSALHTRFRPLEGALVARQSLEHLLQGNMSVDLYASRFQSLLTSIDDMSEADKIYRFVANLRNGLKAKVMQERHTTLRGAIQSAGSHEAAWQFSRSAKVQPFIRFTSNSRSDASGTTPMDVNNVESEPIDEDGESSRGMASSNSAVETALAALAAKLDRFDQRLNAVTHQRPAGFGQRRPNDRVPGLTSEDLEHCLRKGLCLFCKQPGHMKRECPKRGQPQQQRQGK
jgi:hypothetical protein